MTPIEQAKIFSEAKLDELRAALANIVESGDIVLTCGSYARREASATSDIDFFIITERIDQSNALPWAVSVAHDMSGLGSTRSVR